MLDRHADKVSIFVQIDQDVFIDILGLRDSAITEFKVCRIRVRKVSDFHDSPPEQAIKERIVDGFSVLQQDHPKEFSSSLFYPCPPPDPPVSLPFFVNRVVHSELDPLIFDHLPVGTIPHKFEILRCFHRGNNIISEGSMANPMCLAITMQENLWIGQYIPVFTEFLVHWFIRISFQGDCQ